MGVLFYQDAASFVRMDVPFGVMLPGEVDLSCLQQSGADPGTCIVAVLYYRV